MGFCNVTTPPEDCVSLRYWLWNLVGILATTDPVKCGTSTGDPTTTNLEDLWGSCDVPPGAFATWYNSTSGETTYWYCKDGSVAGCDWVEFTLT